MFCNYWIGQKQVTPGFNASASGSSITVNHCSWTVIFSDWSALNLLWGVWCSWFVITSSKNFKGTAVHHLSDFSLSLLIVMSQVTNYHSHTAIVLSFCPLNHRCQRDQSFLWDYEKWQLIKTKNLSKQFTSGQFHYPAMIYSSATV